MKSPRNWLFERHQASIPRLDAMRISIRPSRPSLREFFRELLYPHRVAWRVLAAAWAILVLFHFTLGRSPRRADPSMPPPELLAALIAENNFHDTLAQNDRNP